MMPSGKIFDLGVQGDGLIREDERTVFISGTLPGEEVVYETDGGNRGTLREILTPSPERVAPECPFYGTCGGCVLQHASSSFYRSFKLKELKSLFPADGTFPECDEPVFVPSGTRRRATFALVWNGPSRWFGFNRRRSSEVLSVDRCPLLVPELERLIPPLRRFLTDRKRLFGKRRGEGDVSVLWTETGADILITLPFEPDLGWREAAADFVLSSGAARLSWRFSERRPAEPLITARPPSLTVGDFRLIPPPGVFLQPSREGEAALQAKVREYVGKAKKITDLFCGAGTFTLALLEKGRKLSGLDNAPDALKALSAASAGRVKTEERDLFRVPVLPDELTGCDAVIFDPPRAGAKAQCEQLAFSGVPKIVAVSCNPVSFVRDAGILIGGGYRLTRLAPVDQFIYSPHMELAALFEK